MKMTDNKWLRNSFVWVIIMVAMLVLFFTFVQQRTPNEPIPISKVADAAKAGELVKIVAHEESNDITVYYKNNTVKTSVKEGNTDVQKYLLDRGVPQDKLPEIVVEKAPTWGNYVGILG